MSEDSRMQTEMTNRVRRSIVDAYVVSAELGAFNGVSGKALLKWTGDELLLRKIHEMLIKEDDFSVSFASIDINPHIKRLPELPPNEQIKRLQTEKLAEFCVYPSAAAVMQHENLPDFTTKPFSQMLLQVKAQLDFVCFELQVLSRYTEDPRYSLDFGDYMGDLSISDKCYLDQDFSERDKVGLQTFGLGFDTQKNPVVVVFLRYLANLSPEHQQYWNSFRFSGEAWPSKPYYESSFEGNFWDNRSLRYAISAEIRVIRQMTLAAWGTPLFRQELPILGAIELTAFQLPTQKNFDSFVHSLDKVLSENIDKNFFKGRVRQKDEIISNGGEREVRNRGSLAMLEEWLRCTVNWESEEKFREIIIAPLETVRRLRQKPAHGFTLNSHSGDFTKKRRKLLWDVYNSLANMRRAFQTYAPCSSIEIPEWLDSEQIDVF